MSISLKSVQALKRHPRNPLLHSGAMPFESSLVFNAGVVKFNGKYVMVFRNDYGVTEKDFLAGKADGGSFKVRLGLATSSDGVSWEVDPEKSFLTELVTAETPIIYDPRLTVIDGRCYMCFAAGTRHGIRGGIAVTDDFENFELLSMSIPDNRNMVLFPERIGGHFLRLERPFTVYSRGGVDRFDIWMSSSPDCRHWGGSSLLLSVEDIPFCDDKLGPAAPPVRTSKGWLTLFHSVDRDPSRGKNGWEPKWQKRYSAGIMLLDLEDPRKVIGLCKQPLMVPEAPYETKGGYRNDVVFPGGMILEDSGEVKIYYGAADTVECLATAHVDDLLKLCLS